MRYLDWVVQPTPLSSSGTFHLRKSNPVRISRHSPLPQPPAPASPLPVHGGGCSGRVTHVDSHAMGPSVSGSLPERRASGSVLAPVRGRGSLLRVGGHARASSSVGWALGCLHPCGCRDRSRARAVGTPDSECPPGTGRLSLPELTEEHRAHRLTVLPTSDRLPLPRMPRLTLAVGLWLGQSRGVPARVRPHAVPSLLESLVPGREIGKVGQVGAAPR